MYEAEEAYADNVIFCIDSFEGNLVYTRCAVWHAQDLDLDTFRRLWNGEIVTMPDGCEVAMSDEEEED